MLTFRKAKEPDVDILFQWANDPVARENSFNTTPIPYSEHVDWFSKEIKKEHSEMLIFEEDRKKIGVVRISKNDEKWLIGINIDKDQRGKGLAVPMLQQSIIYFFTKVDKAPVEAFIKKSNIASKRVFEKAGFVYDSDVIINTIESFKYKIYSHENR